MTIQWSLVLFTVLAGCGAWLCACVAIDEFRGAAAKVRVPASVAAVVLLAVGGIASATHLSHVDRMMAALAHPAPGIFLEALLLGLLAVCAIVYAVLVARRAGAGARKAVAVAGIVLAAAVCATLPKSTAGFLVWLAVVSVIPMVLHMVGMVVEPVGAVASWLPANFFQHEVAINQSGVAEFLWNTPGGLAKCLISGFVGIALFGAVGLWRAGKTEL